MANTPPVADSLLKQDVGVNGLNEKWVNDITYTWADASWTFLAVILDLFTWKIVGCHAAARMDVNLVLGALIMAIKNSGNISGVILHSDRGVQIVRRRTKKNYRAMILFAA